MDKPIMPIEEYRNSDFYKSLTPYLACAYAEGFCEGSNATYDEQGCAWQYIWDTSLWRQLQGWYGRTVHQLVREGHIKGDFPYAEVKKVS